MLNHIMKKFWSFMVVALVTLSAGFTSCSDDDGPKGPSTQVTAPSENDGTITATTAAFKFTTNGVTELAYKAVKAGEVARAAATPEAELIFAEAVKTIPMQDGENTVVVEGLEGETEYVVYFAMKTVDNTFLLEQASVTTASYGDQILTMISTSPFSVKFHVNVADTTNWILNFGDRATYEQMKMYFGQSDADFLGSIGNVHYQGPQTIEIKDGDLWYREYDMDWSTGEIDSTSYYDYTYTVKPGDAYVLLLSAAYYGEVPYSWPVTYRWMPDYTYDYDGGYGDDDWWLGANSRAGMNLGEYTQECTDEGVVFNREYAKQYLWTAPAAVPVDTVEVTIKKMTERTAIFEMVPPEDCLSYHVLPLSDEDYNMLLGFVGEAGMQAYALNYGEPMTGGNEYVMEGLTVGANYHMLVTGLFSEDGGVQSFYHATFSPKESTLPAPVLEVSAVSEKNTHDMVYFNIKCTSKDAKDVKFIANYVKDWVPELNSGYSYADMVETYGQYLTEEELKEVNSEAGLEISYPSAEESDTRLAVIAYNEDEKACEAVWADSRSLSIPAKDKVESTLYTDLDGEWVLNYYDTNNYYEKNTWRKFNSVITQNPDFAPASFEEWKGTDSYNYVVEALGGEEATVKALFNEYKEVAAHFAAKYEGQNQMVGVNFPCGNYVYAAKQNVFTPWDLFTSEYYSAYDCYQLFYDFGPKVMFEVVGANEMVMKSDINQLAPLANFDGSYYMVGISNQGYLPNCEFPVTISEDKNTLTVHPAEVDGEKYYPGVIRYYSASYAATQNRTNDVLVYTRGSVEEGWKPAATKPFSVDNVIKSAKAMYNTNNLVAVKNLSAAGKRSAKVKNGPKLNRVEGKVFDVKANFEKNKK